MIELQVDVELKDTIMVAMPKLVGEGFYMCTIRVEYEWKPLRCLSYKVFGHVIDECYKNIISDVEKNLKNPKRFARGVHVGLKVVFKYIKQVYIPVSNKNNVSSSGNKKQVVVASKEVSNLNLFNELNLVENDDDLGTNEEDSKPGGNGPNCDMFPSNYEFLDVASSSTITIVLLLPL
nr:hypothetical protein [Tanacetum cinerariifolium]